MTKGYTTINIEIDDNASQVAIQQECHRAGESLMRGVIEEGVIEVGCHRGGYHRVGVSQRRVS